MKTKKDLENEARCYEFDIAKAMEFMSDELERQGSGSAVDINLDRIEKTVRDIRRMQRGLEGVLFELEAYEA